MEAKRVVAIDIGGTKIASALVTLRADESPEVEYFAKVPTQAAEGGEVVLANVIASARRVLEACGGDACGIGVSSAGVIDPATGDVTYANEIMPGWGGTHLGSELAAACGLPVRVLNDVHAHALGEVRWGAGRGRAACLVVAVGTGVGGAFAQDGHIMLGANGGAGSIGHMSCTDAVGVPCACGAMGHMETVAAGPGIISRYLELGGEATDDDGRPVDGAVIDRRAAAGERAAIEAEARSGHALGEVMGSLTNMLDPDCIILSGSVAQCGEAWHKAMDAGWGESVMPPVAKTPILSGELGGNAPLIGAAEHLLDPAYK
jgi:glucokinase